MTSGNQIRDFIPVDQVASILSYLSTCPTAYGVYNCGSGMPISLREMAERHISSSNSSISLKLGAYPDRKDEPLAFGLIPLRLMV